MRRWFLVPFALVVLGGFYIHGSFDRLLSGVGLNFHECARNGLGATFCGTELDEYRQRVQAIKTRLNEASTATETAARHSREEGERLKARRETSLACTRAQEHRRLEASQRELEASRHSPQAYLEALKATAAEEASEPACP